MRAIRRGIAIPGRPVSPPARFVQRVNGEKFRWSPSLPKMWSRDFAVSHGSGDDITRQNPEDSLFAKIVNKSIPAQIVFEDESTLAFRDINPVAPEHILIIPKRPIGGVSSLCEDDEKIVGHCMRVARLVAELEGITQGYRLVVNEGKHGQQSVRWLHIHLIGGQQLTWPPFST